MIRILCLMAISLLPASALVQAADGQSPATPALKANVTVLDEIVRIGDLVENAGAVADVPIFRAPDLGQTGSVPAERVAAAVRPHQIPTLDTRGIPEVIVTRASRAITAKEIEARLLRALAGQYGLAEAKNLAVSFDNEVRTLHVEPGVNAELAISRLSYEPRSHRFDVIFNLPGSIAARRLPLRFFGVVSETFETIVLAHPVAAGEVLKASDLVVERRPKSELSATTITAIEQAEGFAARGALRSGQSIRRSDLMKPELVQRNETVAITYEVPGILLTMRGKALEPGTRGDLINVLNVQSNRTIQATVTGPGRVSVSSAAPRVVSVSPALAQSNARNRTQ